VQVAKDAEQKYMLFNVKHHDGFCLYAKLSERITCEVGTIVARFGEDNHETHK